HDVRIAEALFFLLRHRADVATLIHFSQPAESNVT
ncbi:MAG: hypothetical protein JWQ72_1832, partial [Polaromonas sp.]|nr:hypothetical protein [Polaromonas sp.]